MINRGLLIIITGSSGVGKNTILKKVFQDKSLNLKYSISATTRTKRKNEIDGVDYHFLTKKEFENRIKNNEFLEYADFVGNKYGTLKSYVEEQRDKGFNVVLEIEVQGGLNVMKMLSDYLSIFIVPPSLDELKNRLIKRDTESFDEIEKRMEAAKWEMSKKDAYQHIIVNDDSDKAAELIKEIIRNAK